MVECQSMLNPPFQPFTVVLVFFCVASLGAMVIANVVYERGVPVSIVVQAVGLIMVSGFASCPWIATKRDWSSRPRASQRAEYDRPPAEIGNDVVPRVPVHPLAAASPVDHS